VESGNGARGTWVRVVENLGEVERARSDGIQVWVLGTSLDRTAFEAACALVVVWIVCSPHRPPYGWYKVIFCCFAIPNEASTGLRNLQSGSCEVLLETLVVL